MDEAIKALENLGENFIIEYDSTSKDYYVLIDGFDTVEIFFQEDLKEAIRLAIEEYNMSVRNSGFTPDQF